MSYIYNGLEFKTNLEARWAAFFDLAGWKWWVNPVSIADWKADFKVSFPCSHSECSGSHTLFISILPISEINIKHPSLNHYYSVESSDGECLADSGALFGDNPNATLWEMAHGAGGGIETVSYWVKNSEELWQETLNRVNTRIS